jgi:hypothetical protein
MQLQQAARSSSSAAAWGTWVVTGQLLRSLLCTMFVQMLMQQSSPRIWT